MFGRCLAIIPQRCIIPPMADLPAPPASALPATPATAPPPKPDAKARIDFLWKVMARFDAYILSVNAKAALIGTFDMFILGTIVLKWAELRQPFDASSGLAVAANTCIWLAAVAA